MSGQLPNTLAGDTETVAQVEARATSLGLIPFFAGAFELFLDLDRDMFIHGEVFAVLDKVNPIKSSLTTTSVNGNRHVYFRLEHPINDLMRVALESALGSDPVRQTLMALRAYRGYDTMDALFETVEEAVKVAKWRMWGVEPATEPEPLSQIGVI